MLRTCLAVILVVSSALAQVPAREGLDSLSDDALMNELASRGLDTLLSRAFEVNKIPPAEQNARRTLISLSRLADPNAKLSATQRQELVREIVRGIEPALPGINDPQLLMRQAYVLVTTGVERDVNTLEYWGENPRTQDQLRPVVETVIKILDRCERLARTQADELANRITSPSSPMAGKFEELDRLAATAEYTRHMAYYYLALSLDRSSGRRRQVAQEAFDYLKQFDVEENPDQNIVRTRMAKLMLVQGNYESAREIFDRVTEGPTADTKNVAIQYEARYFAAVSELLAQNLSASRQHLQDLLAWQQQNLPRQDQAARAGAEAAAAMLQYRIHALEASLARDAASRKAANDASVKVLMDLLAKRPDLRAIIYEQLLPKLDVGQDLSQVDALALRATVSRGEEQLRLPANQTDINLIERALAAAREIVARGTRNDIEPQLADSAALLEGFFLDRLDRKPQAAKAFMDYAERAASSNLKNANLAIDNAQAIIGQLRNTQREETEAAALYERFLTIAIAPPFSRTQFAFEWARRLHLNGNYHQAISYYRLVDEKDSRALDARYFELVALKQLLEDDPAAQPPRDQILTEIQRLADEVNRSAAARLAPPQPGAPALSDQQKQNYRLMLARTALLAGDLARREQKDPARAIKLMENFEQSVQGLPGADALLADAMFIRVQAYMAMERYNDATQQLVRLLQQSEGGQGAQIVYNLLEKLNHDFDRAQATGDIEQMRSLAKNRAQLSGFLVDWAANNPDPNIKRFTYRYKVFDADTHRRAADLSPDPQARQAGLVAAREKFKTLESPENVELYRQSIDPSLVDPNAPDPQVELGQALIEYDLAQWNEAADRFSRLLTSRRIGSPVNAIEEGGDIRYVENELYWEAVLKLMRCNLQLGTGIEESKQFLKQQYITWGTRVGGKKWKAEFETLRAQLIPEFVIEDEPSPATGAASTQP